MRTFVETIAKFSGLSSEHILAAARSAPYTYKMYKVRKRKGGDRTIFHPSKQTKTIQYLILELLISKLPVHDSALAYRRGIASPLRLNAITHSRNSYLLKLDFKDFFPSIKPVDLIGAIRTAVKHSPSLLSYQISSKDEEFISNALFVKYPGSDIGLAIGAPSSPGVSNIVMHELDLVFQKIASEHDAIYTRYADDLAFSTSIKGNCAQIHKAIETAISRCKSPALTLHPKKIRFLSKRNRRPLTGLIIGCDSKVSIGNRAKHRTRSLLYRFSTKRTNADENQYLKGYLAFIRDSDSDFYNSLVIKYGLTLIQEARELR